MLFAAVASVLLFQTFIAVITARNCTDGLKSDGYTKEYGNTCYLFVVDKPCDYRDALRKCGYSGGVLASVTSKEINDFLCDTFFNLHYYKQAWIGLNDIDEENTFEWIDRSPLDYTNWADENEGPRSGFLHLLTHFREDCVAMDMESEGKWRDYTCVSYLLGADERKAFVCEIE